MLRPPFGEPSESIRKLQHEEIINPINIPYRGTSDGLLFTKKQIDRVETMLYSVEERK